MPLGEQAVRASASHSEGIVMSQVRFRTLDVTAAACRMAVAAATLVGGFASPTAAHHSAAPHFDLEKTVVLNGVVTKFEFVNPHAYVYFDVRGGDGSATPWRCELAARLALVRLGWTVDLFPVGGKITIKGAPARREENVCMLTSFIGE